MRYCFLWFLYLFTEHVAGPRGADHEVGDGGGHDRLGVAEGVDAALEGQIFISVFGVNPSDKQDLDA